MPDPVRRGIRLHETAVTGGGATAPVAQDGVPPSCLGRMKETYSTGTGSAGGTPTRTTETVALVRLRRSVHRRVKVPLWRCFPPRLESNCALATECGEQLERKG